MKKLISPLALTAIFFSASAQWSTIFTLKSNEWFISVSAPSDNNTWVFAQNSNQGFVVYNTKNKGATWSRKLPAGLADNISISRLYAINSNVALLGVNTDFTGKGPGIIYRTTDGGKNWVSVFSHRGNCSFLFGMFDEKNGLMSCDFSSISSHSRQTLFSTKDGGKTWKADTLNPSNDFFINGLEVNNGHACLADYNNFYFSGDAGESWAAQKAPLKDSYYNHLQFINRTYAMVNESSLVNLFIRRGSAQWQRVSNPAPFEGAVTGLILDSSECWVSMAFDNVHEFYSSDSAKTFTPQIIDSANAFLIMTKAKTGRTVFGATYGNGGRLWINERNYFTKPDNNILIAAK